MITEKIISFEIAKLAKDKGFDIPTECYYIKERPEDILYASDDGDEPYNWNEREGFSAPSYSILNNWLREKHNYHIQIHFDSQHTHWEFRVYKLDEFIFDTKNNLCFFDVDLRYESYEEAFSGALEYALNLIKIKFSKKFEYNGKMDKEVIDLCNVINSLPGLKTICSCAGHNKESLDIYFYADGTFEGLFFLTRCIDRRYWKHGHVWGIDLSVGDTYEVGQPLPICFRLHSGKSIGKEAYIQAYDLIDNMNLHLNHVNFKKLFNINLNNFILK